MVDVQETGLPGIGLRHEFVTRRGRRVGVVSHRSGRRDFIVYDERDPDAAAVTIELTDDEADTLAEILGAPRIVERIARMNEAVEGLVTEGLRIEPGSPYAGRTLGDTQIRTRTGTSVVAVSRRGEIIASPTPAFRFDEGDTVIVVGLRGAVPEVARILAEG